MMNVQKFTTCEAKIFFPTSNKTIVVIAAHAVLESIQTRVLYFDTDSVIYTSQPGEWTTPLGVYFGQLTNELEKDDYIITFVSEEPKNYSHQTKNGKTVCKV